MFSCLRMHVEAWRKGRAGECLGQDSHQTHSPRTFLWSSLRGAGVKQRKQLKMYSDSREEKVSAALSLSHQPLAVLAPGALLLQVRSVVLT